MVFPWCHSVVNLCLLLFLSCCGFTVAVALNKVTEWCMFFLNLYDFIELVGKRCSNHILLLQFLFYYAWQGDTWVFPWCHSVVNLCLLLFLLRCGFIVALVHEGVYVLKLICLYKVGGEKMLQSYSFAPISFLLHLRWCRGKICKHFSNWVLCIVVWSVD